PDKYFGFFTREFEVITLGRLFRRESDRLKVMDLEVGAGKTNDVLLRVDGQPVYVEFKTLQQPKEELDLRLATQELLRILHDRVQLSAGCDIQLTGIPDADDRDEIAATLCELEARQERRVEREIAAAVIRYGFTESVIGIGFASSPEAAALRIHRVLR